MSGRYLLDTNVVIALFANDTDIKDRLALAEAVFLPSPVLGELYYGARKSGRVLQNLARIDEFAAQNVVLGVDSGTARRYGEVKNALRLKGRPIPENDVWIAALALQHGLTLATEDLHFQEVEGLNTAP